MNREIENEQELVTLVLQSGDKQALEKLWVSVQDMIFNLSLRMLGTVVDAEDATQEIGIRILTNISNFRSDSKFSTWAYRIALNHLLNYKKHMLANAPFSFDFYGQDIKHGVTADIPDNTESVDKALLEQELKYACTNVMLQCLDTESRCIFILGTMFHLDSKIAGEILDMTPEAYRQRLSRIRKKVAHFLEEHCELGGGICQCKNRISYAISQHRINPNHLEYVTLDTEDELKKKRFTQTMEEIDDCSAVFAALPKYSSPSKTKAFINNFLKSDRFEIIKNT